MSDFYISARVVRCLGMGGEVLVQMLLQVEAPILSSGTVCFDPVPDELMFKTVMF